jgi:hypothetical protein
MGLPQNGGRAIRARHFSKIQCNARATVPFWGSAETLARKAFAAALKMGLKRALCTIGSNEPIFQGPGMKLHGWAKKE